MDEYKSWPVTDIRAAVESGMPNMAGQPGEIEWLRYWLQQGANTVEIQELEIELLKAKLKLFEDVPTADLSEWEWESNAKCPICGEQMDQTRPTSWICYECEGNAAILKMVHKAVSEEAEKIYDRFSNFAIRLFAGDPELIGPNADDDIDNKVAE